MKVCLKFNTSFINIVSLILSIIIVGFFSIGTKYIESNFNNENKESKIIINKENKSISKDNSEKTKAIQSKKNEDIRINNEEFDWYIEIPKIKLYAPIEEGTEDEVLNRSIGHFDSTSRRSGNCGLAAHNRGYRVNYFARLKELEKGDNIYYFVDDRKYKYEVKDILIIYETDWSMLEETEDSRITLITCVENRDEYRLCIQGVLVEN